MSTSNTTILGKKCEKSAFMIKTYKDLVDKVLSHNMDGDNYINNKDSINTTLELLNTINLEDGARIGTIMFGISYDMDDSLNLIYKIHNEDDKYGYKIGTHKYLYIKYKFRRDVKSSFKHKVYYNNYTIDIFDKLYNVNINSNLTYDTLSAHIIGEDIAGYCINYNKLSEINDYISSNNKESIELELDQLKDGDIKSLFNILNISSRKSKEYQEINKNQMYLFANRLPELELSNIRTDSVFKYNTNDIIENDLYVGKISDVKTINNNRLATFEVIRFEHETNKLYYSSTVKHFNASESHNRFGKTHKITFDDMYNININSMLSRFTYNYIDSNRLFLAIDDYNNTKKAKVFILEDPRISETYLEDFSKNFDELCKSKSSTFKYIDCKVGGKSIYISCNTKKEILQQLKNEIDEYKFIEGRVKCATKDVSISDNIKYNSEEQKLIYNDFSIKIDSAFITQRLINKSQDLAIEYYNDRITEEKIINTLTDDLFTNIFTLINSNKGFESIESLDDDGNLITEKEVKTINIEFNDCIPITITQTRTINSNGKTTRINDMRINKDEVLPILKEFTCHRNPAEANLFLKNVTKVGLSVFIGMTTGYEKDNKLFKFKKNKGNEYTLILDKNEISFKGKRMINHLYKSEFLNTAYLSNDKLERYIFTSVLDIKDYIKYKFLIDESYKNFIQESAKMLDKKIADTEATKVKYITDNGKHLNGALVTGASGNKYIVAYNQTDSWVFMNPTQDKDYDTPTYITGKYICMMDQSSIKSNIGYDTVISKLMAVKNDSVISKHIYNLDDELN